MKHATQHGAAQSTSTRYFQVLILLFGYFLFGGSGTANLGDRLRDIVDDEDRAEAAAAIGARIEEREAAQASDLVRARIDLYRVLGNRDFAVADLEAALDSAASSLDATGVDLLDMRFELREALTADEWGVLFQGLRDDEVYLTPQRR